MKTKLINFGLLTAACLALMPSTASAQELTLKVEPGLAVPLTHPQDHEFKPGFDGEAKLLLGLGPYFSVGPSFGVLALPTNVSNHGAGTAEFVGGSLGVHRPHDRSNEDTGLAAVSPWAEVDPQWVNTGSHDRFGMEVAVGAAVPTGDDRSVWMGPFLGYQQVFQDQDPGKDSRNSKTLILGLSVEFGAGVARNPSPVVVVPPPEDQTVVITTPPPPPPPSTVVITKHLYGRVQFDFDSGVISTEYAKQVGELARIISRNIGKDMKVEKIAVNGHASDEGHSWAAEHNMKLSTARAQAVADFLVANGIPKDLLVVQGFGTSKPIADNSTEAGREENRRVDFDLTVDITVHVMREDRPAPERSGASK